MKATRATFIKKDGSERTLTFVKLEDLTEEFMKAHLKGGKQKTLKEGMEVVWDLEAKSFKMFNWKTLVGQPEEIEVTEIT